MAETKFANLDEAKAIIERFAAEAKANPNMVVTTDAFGVVAAVLLKVIEEVEALKAG